MNTSTVLNNQVYTIPMLEEVAKFVIDKFDCGENVDVIRLAEKLGFKLYQADFADRDIAGKVEKVGDSVHIYVNRDDHPLRQEFTIAHEIGHMILHNRGEDDYFVDFRNTRKHYDWREVEAENFAAALLMPRAKCEQVWRMCYQDIDDFARMMRVTKLAATIRLRSLGKLG